MATPLMDPAQFAAMVRDASDEQLAARVRPRRAAGEGRPDARGAGAGDVPPARAEAVTHGGQPEDTDAEARLTAATCSSASARRSRVTRPRRTAASTSRYASSWLAA